MFARDMLPEIRTLFRITRRERGTRRLELLGRIRQAHRAILHDDPAEARAIIDGLYGFYIDSDVEQIALPIIVGVSTGRLSSQLQSQVA